MCKLNQGCRLVFYKVNKILRETNIPAKVRIISQKTLMEQIYIYEVDLHLKELRNYNRKLFLCLPQK